MSAIATRVLRYGVDADLPERVPLRAGPLTLFYEAGDLRTIKYGEREVLRRVYVAIRDRNWGTVAPVITNVVMDVQPEHFAISFDVANQEGPIDFAWRGVITGTAEGVIEYAMQGIARSTFMRNRIGFCILHPAECAGAPCEILHVDGTSERAELPELIQPYQPLRPFEEMAALTHQVEPGVRAELRFAGDIFEMEDQRNWTDASFKTFCTPLRIPYPVEVAAGTRVEQAITLRIVDERPAGALATQAGATAGDIAFTVAGEPVALPRLGLRLADADDGGEPLPAAAVTRLCALNLDHLRVDLRLADNATARLQAGMAAAERLGVGLHAALYTGANPDAELAACAEAVRKLQPKIVRWLIYPTPEQFLGGSPIADVLAAAHRHLDGLIPGAQFAAGTDVDFIFLQRNLPPLELVDLLTFSINPQVHAFDNLSLVETLATQAAAVKTCRHLAQGKPVMVSPISLKMRYNPYATAAPPPTPAGQLPANVDVRQLSLFGAAWTVGSVKYVSEAGAESATYYETAGWRGVLEQAAGSPVPEKFPSVAGGVFPLYHVLADIGEFAGGQVLPSRSSDALRVDGLVLRQQGRQRTLVANLSAEPQAVTLGGVSGPCRVRVLDETTALTAMQAPEQFRAAFEAISAGPAGLRLALRPYAVACVDVENAA